MEDKMVLIGSQKDALMIMPNHGEKWEDSKNREEPFYIEIGQEGYIGLSISQAEELRDYLTKAIELVK